MDEFESLSQAGPLLLVSVVAQTQKGNENSCSPLLLFPSAFEPASLTDPALHHLSSSSSQQAPGMCLSLRPQPWGYRYAPPSLAPNVGAGI